MKIIGINYISVLELFHEIQNYRLSNYDSEFESLDLGNILEKYKLPCFQYDVDEELKEALKSKSNNELIKIYQDLLSIKFIKWNENNI